MVKFKKCLVIGVPGGVTKGLEKWAAKSDIQINQNTTLPVTKRLLKKYQNLKEKDTLDIFFLARTRVNIRKQHHLEKNTILTEVKMIIISNIILEKTNLELQQIHKYKYTKTK